MFKDLFKWILLSVVVGLLVGTASWAFHSSLNAAINYRKNHEWLIFFLPFIGALVAWFYQKFGQNVDGGNNLILDEIREAKKTIPLRMGLMIFMSSVLSHLFGASVGREGAAVQIGSSISDQFTHYFGTFFNNRKIVLMVGMSAGFASIFGTPWAGAVFGLEILFARRLLVEAFLPCLIAAFVGHLTAQALGIIHNHYQVFNIPPINLSAICFVLVAGICFGLAARFFVWLLHWVKDWLSQKWPNPIHRPLLGGVVMVLCFILIGSDRYMSLGQEIINASFHEHLLPWDFLGKILMTSLSVGSGFRGGEVMPLFYIGATLGNALSLLLPLSLSFLAALGFVSVFAGASNTPITSLLLVIGIFGIEMGFYGAIAIVMSYLVSGHKGIYRSHRRHRFKKF